jgi:hypothetical protein
MEELATTAPSSDTVPTEQQPEPPVPEEEELDAPVEAVPGEPPAKAPAREVRIRKPRKASAPSIVIPEIDDRFWANLLATQRDAERATRLQRISEFNLL